jgi:hypothetical protein
MINCIGWRGDLQKPPGLYKGGHLLMKGDYILSNIKKLINNSRGKYKRNECLINVCKSDTDLS